MRAFHITAFVLALAAPLVFAFEVDSSGASIGEHNSSQVFKIGESTYTVTSVPNFAEQFEVFQTPSEDYIEGTKGLTLGSRITADEALKVIEEFYREKAFNFASIKIRKLQLGDLQYVAWCSKPSLFFCMLREFRTGNWVEFEVNGGNLTGGLTGFQRQVFMIRKL